MGSARAGGAAVVYTLVAACQKVSGFIVLIAFTRILAPAEYGLIALLTTVGGLIAMVLTLGQEPRITYAIFRMGQELGPYLSKARQLTIGVPLVVGTLASGLVWMSPIGSKWTWIAECMGASMLAAGTTYPYAMLRARRLAARFAFLALVVLSTQVLLRVVLVAAWGMGSEGWALADLVSGVVALCVGPISARLPTDEGSPQAAGPTYRTVLSGGLFLVPHYVAQWGLSLSDRLILAFYVTTAEVGVYSAIYQFGAVVAMILNEVNRALMPSYAQQESGGGPIENLVRLQLVISLTVHAACLVLGFLAIDVLLPTEYGKFAWLFPYIALSSLAYAIYFIPMNGLTLVAGVTAPAPLISLSALAVNLVLNVSLDSQFGIRGAAIATVAGYAALAAIAVTIERRRRAIPWGRIFQGNLFLNLGCLSIVSFTIVSSLDAGYRLIGILGVAASAIPLAAVAVRDWPSVNVRASRN